MHCRHKPQYIVGRQSVKDKLLKTEKDSGSIQTSLNRQSVNSGRSAISVVQMSFLRLVWTLGIILSMGVKEITSHYSQCLNGYCFSTDKTWYLNLTDARALCIRNSSYLATITSQDIQDDIITFINNAFAAGEMSNSNSFLLNAKRIGYTWTWVNGRDLQSALKTDLVHDDAYWLTHASIERTYNTRLYASQSFDNKSFICGYPGDRSTCNRGLYFNNTCYIINNTQRSWFEARYYCLQSGGDLAMLDFANSTQDLVVFHESFLNSSIPYWIGLKRHSWYWEYPADVEFKYTSWGRERPLYYDNANCSCLDYNFLWKWSQCDCTHNYPFICVKTIATSTTKATTVTTTSPFQSTTATSRPSTASSSTSTSLTPTSSSSTSTSSAYDYWLTLTSLPSTSSHMHSEDSSSVSNKSTNATAASQLTSNNTLALAIGIGVGVGVPLVLGLIVLIMITMQRKKLREVEDKNPESNQYTPSFYEDPLTAVRDLPYANKQPKKPIETNFYETVASEFSLQDNYDRIGVQRRENYSNAEELFGSDPNPVPHFIRPSSRDTMYGDIRF